MSIGNVTATGDAWLEAIGRWLHMELHPDTNHSWGSVGSVQTGGNLSTTAYKIGGDVLVGGDITRISTAHLTKNITVTGNLEALDARSISGNILAHGQIGDPQWGGGIYADGNITGAIHADGIIDTVNARGSIAGPISAGGTIQEIVALRDIQGTITAGDIQFIRAGEELGATILAGTTLDSVSAGSMADASIVAGSIGSVWSASDILGTTIDAVQDIDHVEAYYSLEAQIAAGTNIGSIEARYVAPSTTVSAIGQIHSVNVDETMSGLFSATGSIVQVQAGEITATISSGGDTDSITSRRDASGSISVGGDLDDLIVTSGSLTGNVNVTGNIIGWHNQTIDYGINAARDISGTITAGGAIGAIDAGGSVTGPVTASGGGIFWLYAGESISGRIEAGGDLTVGKAGEAITGDVIATGSIGALDADRGGITSSLIQAGGDISSVTAAGAIGSGIGATTISAGGSVNSISSAGPIGASVTAGTFVGTLNTDSAIAANVTAGTYVGGVTAAGNVSGSIEAGGQHITSVTSTYGSISASVKSATDVGSITAHGSISGRIEAGAAIGNSPTAATGIQAHYGSVTSSDIISGGCITAIRAGADITAPITAAAAHIGTVEAGTDGIGNITGAVSAGTTIGSLIARDVGQLPEVPDGAVRPNPRRIDGSAGNITGAITAGGQIDLIEAFGSLGIVSAGGTLPEVKVGGDATGTIDAGGQIKADVWGSTQGAIAATSSTGSDVDLHVYQTVHGNVTSSHGYIDGGSWGEILGDLTAGNDDPITMWAQDNIDGDATAGDTVTLTSFHGDITGDVTAGDDAYLLAENIDSQSVTALGEAYLYADRNITGGSVAHAAAVAAALAAGDPPPPAPAPGSYSGNEGVVAIARTGSVSGGSELVSSAGPVTAWARHDYKGGISAYGDASLVAFGETTITSAIGSSAGGVGYMGGGIGGPQVSAYTTVDLDSLGDILVNNIAGGAVEDGWSAYLTALGNIASTVAGDSFVRVVATGNVSENISGDDGVYVSSGATIDATVTSSAGGVIATGHDGIHGSLTGHAFVVAHTWGDITRPLTSGDGPVAAFAAEGLSAGANVSANHSVGIESWANVDSAEITAGANLQSEDTGQYNAVVTAHGHITSQSITASHDVELLAYETITSQSITADAGLVDLVAVGDITSKTVEAGTSASISTWGHLGGGSATMITAGTTAEVGVHQNANATIQAGGNITVDVTGNLTGKMTSDEGDIAVGTLGAISDMTMTAKLGSVDVLAGSDATNLTITADHTHLSIPDDPQDPAVQDVTVMVVGNLDGKIRARHSADIATVGGVDGGDSPGDVDLNVKVSDGWLTVNSGGSLQGTFKATGQVTASAMAAAEGMYRSSAGDVALSTAGAIDATVNAAGSADVFAGESMEGSIHAGTSAGVTAGGDVEATVTAGTDADVLIADGSLRGSVTAQQGKATVTVCGKIEAKQPPPTPQDPNPDPIPPSISGHTGVDVWAKGGIEGATTSTGPSPASIASAAGPVTVTSFGDIKSNVAISATGGDVTVYGNTKVGGTISSDQNAYVTAMTGSSAAITADLDADLFAGGDSSGAVWARNRATVTVTGTVSGNVTANVGDAAVSANDQITSNINAGQNATVSALGAITGGSITAGASADVTTWAEMGTTVNATRNANVWACGTLSGNVTAGTDADAFARETISGNINAGANANVTAFASITGEVIAGAAADLASFANVQGNVAAGTDATVFAMGNISAGAVSAQAGSLDASAFGTLSASISAGGNIDAWSGGNMTLPSVTAGGSATLTSQGGATQLTAVNAGQNVSITAFGTLDALNVTAAGDADVFATGATRTDINATNAWVFSTSDVEATLATTADAGVTALGASLKTNITAGGDAGVYTSGAIAASIIDAAGAASMIAATQIANSTVDGEAGAFAMSGGDMTVVNVQSSSGPVAAVTSGNVASSTLTAATDASLLSGGEVSTSTLTATELVGLVAAGDVLSTIVDAGTDAVVVGLGNISLASLDAGADAMLHALGDVSATATVGGTLWATTDGSLSGNYTVEDDIVGLWARDDITGTYLSHDNVESVVSQGGINASITAGGLASPTDDDGDGYGEIRYVRAWNDVAGSLTADESIEEVIAGGVVSATLIAPYIGTVTDGDRTGFDRWDDPAVIEFDWLSSVTGELQYMDGLISDVIAEAVAAAQRVSAVVQAEASARLADAVAGMAEAYNAATQQASNVAVQLAEASTSAADEADRVCSEVQDAVDAALTELYASEEAGKLLADQKLSELKDGNEADFQASLVQKTRTSGAANAIEEIASALEQQMQQCFESYGDDVDVVADRVSRDLASEPHPISSPKTNARSFGTAFEDIPGMQEVAHREVADRAQAGVELYEGLVSITPGISTLYDGWTLYSDEHIDGTPMSGWDRFFAWTGVVGSAAGAGAGMIGNVADAARTGRNVGKLADAGGNVASVAKNGDIVTAVRVGSGLGSDIRPAATIRTIGKGEKVDDLIQELAQRTYESGGLEHAIVSLKDGRRVIVHGGADGITFGGDVKRVIGHTHPTPTGPSQPDFDMLEAFGQVHSYIYELFGGGLTRFGRL